MRLISVFSLLAITGTAHAQPWIAPPEPAPELEARPGTVAVSIGSVGRPLQLNGYSGSASAVIHSFAGPAWMTLSTFRPLCETPCTLYLPPGRREVQVTGYGVYPHIESIDVPPMGVDLALRAPSTNARVGGFLMLGTAVGAAVVGATLIAMGKSGNGEVVQGGVTDAPHFVTHEDMGIIIGGGILVGVGAAMMAGSVALILSSRGGVAWSRAHDRSAPTAKLSIGAGNLRVSGSF